MTDMQFDFSALDRELESLGQPAEDALALARKFAQPGNSSLARERTGSALGLDEIDRTLAALESDGGSEAAPPTSPWDSTVPVTAAPTSADTRASSKPPRGKPRAFYSEPPAAPRSEPPAARSEPPTPTPTAPESEPPAAYSEAPPAPVSVAPSAPPLTQSQEIVLPDPIARDELSTESGELRLDGPEPSSGSFELPESSTEPRIEPRIEQHARELTPSPTTERVLTPFDDVQDALEGSQPLLLDSAHRDLSSFGDRDPDAEFDALLSEATDPRGIPTGSGTSGEVDTDDLLRGLEGDDLGDDVLSVEELTAAEADEPNEAERLTRSLFEDTGDNTEVIHRDMFAAAESGPKTDPDPTLADELDSGELEIVMDDDGATLAPPPGPQSSKAPPPPPPAAGEKRPSLLGRIFNKRDPE
jgi:hypothetical protein